MLSIANEVDSLIYRCVCFVCDTNMYFSIKDSLDPGTNFLPSIVLIYISLLPRGKKRDSTVLKGTLPIGRNRQLTKVTNEETAP